MSQADDKEFPILCENCLGDTPFVRMSRDSFGKACRTCDRPFHVFRWRPGPRSRLKTTEICSNCSKLKNVCQSCFLDLEFGVSIQVRDTVLAKDSSSEPISQINRQHLIERMEQTVALGKQDSTLPLLPHYGRSQVEEVTRKLADREPFHTRNLDLFCAFHLRDTCNKGKNCPHRHEKLPKGVQLDIPPPPLDLSARTLFIGGIEQGVEETALRTRLESFGTLKSFRFFFRRSIAFAEYQSRKSAEEAMRGLWGFLEMEGVQMTVGWARSKEPDTTNVARIKSAENVECEKESKETETKNTIEYPDANINVGIDVLTRKRPSILVPPPPGLKIPRRN